MRKSRVWLPTGSVARNREYCALEANRKNRQVMYDRKDRYLWN